MEDIDRHSSVDAVHMIDSPSRQVPFQWARDQASCLLTKLLKEQTVN